MNENLKGFLLKLQADEDLRKRVETTCEGLSDEALATKVAAVATEEGFPLVAEDFRSGATREELEEAELAQVAAGGFCIVSGFHHWFSGDNPSACIFTGENKDADFSCTFIGW